jgi:hypothetical protein
MISMEIFLHHWKDYKSKLLTIDEIRNRSEDISFNALSTVTAVRKNFPILLFDNGHEKRTRSEFSVCLAYCRILKALLGLGRQLVITVCITR